MMNIEHSQSKVVVRHPLLVYFNIKRKKYQPPWEFLGDWDMRKSCLATT